MKNNLVFVLAAICLFFVVSCTNTAKSPETEEAKTDLSPIDTIAVDAEHMELTLTLKGGAATAQLHKKEDQSV